MTDTEEVATLTVKLEGKKELKQLDLKRLFTLQKLEVDTACYYVTNNSMYDKNDIYNVLQEILAINTVITEKLKHHEK